MLRELLARRSAKWPVRPCQTQMASCPALSPSLFAPIFLGFAFDARRGRILALDPIARASRAVGRSTAIIKKTISTIADDDDRFVAGIFVFAFSDYFTLVLSGNFEEASTLAMMKVLGIEEFHRSFDTMQ